MSDYITTYLDEVKQICDQLDKVEVENMIKLIAQVRADGGRLFFIGVGGGAGNASHAVNDFRKIGGVESYAPTDNVAEFTALVNDEGWAGVFKRWLMGSKMDGKDGVFVFSVGGGNEELGISANVVEACKYAKEVGAKVMGVVGRDGGFTKSVADACVVIPTMSGETVTPHTEEFQGLVWHLIVSHPAIQKYQMKWESVTEESDSEADA